MQTFFGSGSTGARASSTSGKPRSPEVGPPWSDEHRSASWDSVAEACVDVAGAGVESGQDTLRMMGSRNDERLEELRRVLVQGPTPVTVVVVDPDPAWPAQYEAYAADLRLALGHRLRLVEHIGSTAVAGLPAKPVIDIVAGIDDPDDEAAYLADLIAAGWDLRVREPGHRCLRAEASPPARSSPANLHCYEPASPEIDRYLRLRDRLRTDPGARSRYADLKRSLAGREWPDMNLYADAKGPLIRELLGDNGDEG